MKLANINSRAALVVGDRIADVGALSGGRFGPDPASIYHYWDAFVAFVST